MTPPARSDLRDALDRLKVADDTLQVTAALRIAMRTLAWYGKESNWTEDDWGVRAVVVPPDYGNAGQKARNAIKRIEKQLDPDRSPSPLAEAEEHGA